MPRQYATEAEWMRECAAFEDTFAPDYVVEERQLSDREVQDFRYMFLDFCAHRVQETN